MTRKETAQMLALLSASYPRFGLKTDELALSAWHEMLQDLPGNVVAVAVKRMIATLKFPPTIADIRGAVADATRDANGTLSAGDAWRKVRKAISNYGFYRPDEARAYLGEDVWRTVEMVGGWSEICVGEDSETVLSAQFERRYNAMINQQAERIQIPASVRDEMARLVAPMAERMMIGDAVRNDPESP